MSSLAKVAIWAYLQAKPGKEGELETFLKGALPLAESEKGTTSWFAVKIDKATFGIFDTFADNGGRDAHLNGPIAKALMEKAPDLLAKPPSISKVDILAAKLS